MTDPIPEIAAYYSDKLAQHGQTARGVDWNGEESQLLRFEQLAKVIDIPGDFSVNDLGCGYGALLGYLRPRFAGLTYYGQDISQDMIDAANERFGAPTNVYFQHTAKPPQIADFSFASGIFNVRLALTEDEWGQYVLQTLDLLNAVSKRGFAFNCLTSYSDVDKMRDYLHYARPGETFDLCKTRYSKNVALLHDYGLYEFTMLVRKL